MIKKILLGVVVLVLAAAGYGYYKNSKEPADLWTVTGTFPGCPEKASCVSSVANEEVYQISPLGYPGPDFVLARQKLEAAVRSLPGAQVHDSTSEYMHVVFTSSLLHLSDDVELLVQPAVVQVRSISRFGFGNGAANRERVEALRTAFTAQYAQE